MRRWLPYPLLAASLVVMWLLLTQSFSPGQVLLSALAAFLGTQAMVALRPEPSRVQSLKAVIRLAAIVVIDIVRSNFAVARIILSPRRERVSGFVTLPLRMKNRHGLAVLALIITATPGTIWLQFDRSSGLLLVHVLDLVDEDEWIRLIEQRYESLLLEIFGS